MTRSQDIGSLILGTTERDAAASQDSSPDELFVSEALWQTYRRGRWKSMQLRASNQSYPHLEFARPEKGEAFLLFDLLEDPTEQREVASLHPEVVAEHRARLRELSESLSDSSAARTRLSPEDERRLRALGYLD